MSGARGRELAAWSSFPAASLLILAGCAGAPVQTGPPMDDAPARAERLASMSGVEHPSLVRFRWEYGDRKGRLSGEGVARVTPPDSFRLDLFTAGDGSMAAVLTEGVLHTLGQIEDVELPPPSFLYAMAGVFRPGPYPPSAGFRDGEDEVLVYGQADDMVSRFRIREGRVMEVEEHEGRRLLRRITLDWRSETRWPDRAEYRDQITPSRVRWELVEARPAEVPYPSEIYELGAAR